MKAIANLLCKLNVIGLFFVETIYYSLTLILAYPVVPWIYLHQTILLDFDYKSEE